MGKKNTPIKHEGTIVRIEGTGVYVQIIQYSACAGCHVQSACTAADKSEKIIETFCADPSNLRVGQRVWIIGTQSMSNEALRLGFVYPFLVMCATLVVAYLVSRNEAVTGVAALLSLLPYYVVLYLLRHKIKKELVFTLEIPTRNENL